MIQDFKEQFKRMQESQSGANKSLHEVLDTHMRGEQNESKPLSLNVK